MNKHTRHWYTIYTEIVDTLTDFVSAAAERKQYVSNQVSTQSRLSVNEYAGSWMVHILRYAVVRSWEILPKPFDRLSFKLRHDPIWTFTLWFATKLVSFLLCPATKCWQWEQSLACLVGLLRACTTQSSYRFSSPHKVEIKWPKNNRTRKRRRLPLRCRQSVACCVFKPLFTPRDCHLSV